MAKTPADYSHLPKLAVRPDEAGYMLSVSPATLKAMGARPSYQRQGLTLYDVRELRRVLNQLAVEAGMDKHEWEG